uniref:Uncharacterized protein n=1 Tax=Mus musculus TaxID=10090 RepID=Q3TRR1_MOUSE|nr:unnamed protein product [Mus musculus]
MSAITEGTEHLYSLCSGPLMLSRRSFCLYVWLTDAKYTLFCFLVTFFLSQMTKLLIFQNQRCKSFA